MIPLEAKLPGALAPFEEGSSKGFASDKPAGYSKHVLYLKAGQTAYSHAPCEKASVPRCLRIQEGSFPEPIRLR